MAGHAMVVKCNVESCMYNIKKMCHADELEVNPMDDSIPESSDETCCTTFRMHD
ncbi:MAG TPA: DUF1540 domain-containing protein [Clostridiales bacterium]|nr:DUF1540 domain-containing protein [Clostridiales bacterium]